MKVDEQVEETIQTSMKDFHFLLSVLVAFSVSNLDNIPTNRTSREFSVYGHSEKNVLSNHFFFNEEENKDTFIEEWNTFKSDLLTMRKKWVRLKERKLDKK